MPNANEQTTETKPKSTLEQLAENNQLARGVANGTLNAEAEANEEVETAKSASEVASGGEEAPAPSEIAGAESEEEIRIGGQVFKTQAEAFRYAEQLELDKQLAEAHTAGINEVLRAQAANQPAPVVEDKFDEEFYANPKATLEKVRQQAISEAEARIDQKLAREAQWGTFLEKFPDIRRADAERILNENWNTLGKITDLEKGMQTLATKTRAYYAEIEEYRKPRTILSDKKGAQTAKSGGSAQSVTPKESATRPLTMAEQMKSLKRHS